MTTRLPTCAARILAVGCAPALLTALAEGFAIQSVANAADAAHVLAGVHVMIVGGHMPDDTAIDLVARASRAAPQLIVLVERVLARPLSVAIFHVVPPELPPADARAIVHAAAARALGLPGIAEAPPMPDPANTPDAAHELFRVLTAARGLAAQSELGSAANHVVNAIRDLTAAQRAYCWFFDSDTHELWRHGGDHPEACANADRGLVGFAARTGHGVCVADVASDPRHDAELDDRLGHGHERMLVQPVVGADRGVHAVFVAVRSARARPFRDDERARLSAFAACCGPAIHQLGLQLDAGAALGAPPPLFRSEAVEDRTHRSATGDAIRVAPGWVRHAYVALVVMLLTALGYIVLGRVDQYSSGPAVVRIQGRTEVTAHTAGTIALVAVEPGTRIDAGAVLVRLHDPTDVGDRLQREFDEALRDRLADGGDVEVDQSLRSLRSALEESEARRDTLLVRAPHAGVVGDVRVRTGQAVAPGDIVASLVAEPDALQVIAVLPGSDRPMLAPGMPLRLEIHGFPHAYDDLVIESVADEVVGPAEIQRTLGPIAESLASAGSGVIVRARIPSASFVADRGSYRYHDGMSAIGHVRLRRQRVVEVLVPGFPGFPGLPELDGWELGR